MNEVFRLPSLNVRESARKEEIMEKEIVSTELAPGAIGPYSQAAKGAGVVCVSGQLPLDPVTGTMPQTVEEQVAQSMKNVLAILEASGSDRSKILKCCLFIRDMDKFSAINEVYATFFPDEPPARVVVEVSRLPKDALVEIDAIALC